jgi:hypothetical protein
VLPCRRLILPDVAKGCSAFETSGVIQRQRITSQKSWTLSSTAVKTWDITRCRISHCSRDLQQRGRWVHIILGRGTSVWGVRVARNLTLVWRATFLCVKARHWGCLSCCLGCLLIQGVKSRGTATVNGSTAVGATEEQQFYECFSPKVIKLCFVYDVHRFCSKTRWSIRVFEPRWRLDVSSHRRHISCRWPWR